MAVKESSVRIVMLLVLGGTIREVRSTRSSGEKSQHIKSRRPTGSPTMLSAPSRWRPLQAAILVPLTPTNLLTTLRAAPAA